ncbi:hypothetical protein [Burkholderia ubonensis]|uniref:hypothetical protein n=1 Tax=Burkholderia ubonensis TaxID=101571 RepID=UPI001055A9A4|nr:hypothetical protein [Burkholderia ubonensis]
MFDPLFSWRMTEYFARYGLIAEKSSCKHFLKRVIDTVPYLDAVARMRQRALQSTGLRINTPSSGNLWR